ncbi:MAG: head-tail connector protein [Planctomycetota bacterium]|jgi:uncharacterized phiE125 gp8 family phage protein
MPLALTQTVAPSIEPLSLSEAKEQCEYEDNDRDVLFRALITAAREVAELRTQKQFITATYTLELDAFPGTTGVIRLPKPPTQSVTSITYTDSNGDPQTLNASKYDTDFSSEPARIVPAYGETWPTVQPGINRLTVTFVAGYGDAATDVHQAVRNGMKLLIGHWFREREETAPVQIRRITDGAGALFDVVALKDVV